MEGVLESQHMSAQGNCAASYTQVCRKRELEPSSTTKQTCRNYEETGGEEQVDKIQRCEFY